MNKPIVHRLHAGSPDKIMIWTDGSYEVKMHDNINLIDYSKEEIYNILYEHEFILPADEGDIRHANKTYDPTELIDQSWILLPQENVGEGYFKVIDYDSYVPKDSMIYRDLELNTGIKYADYDSLTPNNFLSLWDYTELNKFKKGIAIKTTTGSGSRGVILIDKDRIHLGGKYVERLDHYQYNQLYEFAKKEGCNIMLQSLIPNDPELKKINVDFVIREGKLLGYMWTITNQAQQFTNWNSGLIVNTPYTQDIVTKLSSYLITRGIWNGIMNFEAFSNMKDEIWMVEINWRYSNSMFQAQAAGIDLVGQYLAGRQFSMPEGEHKFTRYWQCKFYDDIPGYHNGK